MVVSGPAAQRRPARPGRFKDRHLAIVDEWQQGCLYCGELPVRGALPGSGGKLQVPFCEKHVRWALASRRERFGKQARNLKQLLYAWVRLHGGDRKQVRGWLGY
jgi:hypothetical protein